MQTAVINPDESAGKKQVSAPSRFVHPWLPDQGDGTYCNPVLYADYSDPDTLRVGDDFFLTASSFNCTPGLPLLHSKDLVNWTLIGHALKNLPHPRYQRVQPGCGVWAPSIRHHAGKYWIFFATPDEGIYVVAAGHPTGKWSEPHLVQEGKGLIDPCPLWDDDGQAYLVHAYAGSRAGIKHRLRVSPMAPDGLRLLGEGQIVFHEPDRYPTLEGPKFLKKDRWYYILAPAGGVENGWQVALRSTNIYGPYEGKTVLSQGDTDVNGPHQGALVDTPANGWWFLHFQDAGPYGRVTHLQPVRWEDGWPVIGRDGNPVLRHAKPRVHHSDKVCAPQTTDEFTGASLGLQWQWQANHRDDWYALGTRPGWLRLFPQLAAPSLTEQPNLLLQKFPARSFTVETMLELCALQSGEEAGLVISGEHVAAVGIQYDGARHSVFLRVHDEIRIICDANSPSMRFRVQVEDGGICHFSYADENGFRPLPCEFQAKKGAWIGAKIGLYSLKRMADSPAGYADFDFFRFV
jgi:beta-xylosidase